jgi:hypothetical protein
MPKNEVLLVETVGKEQAMAGHDIGLNLGVKQARPATSSERKQLLADASGEMKTSVKLASHRKNFAVAEICVKHGPHGGVFEISG